MSDDAKALEIYRRGYEAGYWSSWRKAHDGCKSVSGPFINSYGVAYHCDDCRELKVLSHDELNAMQRPTPPTPT